MRCLICFLIWLYLFLTTFLGMIGLKVLLGWWNGDVVTPLLTAATGSATLVALGAFPSGRGRKGSSGK